MFAICKEDCGERDCGTNLLWVQPKVELQLRIRKASVENG